MYDKRFLKDLAAIPSKYRKEIEHFAFTDLSSFKSIAEANRFEKMSGYENCYKIRLGIYRLGAYCQGNTVVLKRSLHRKEIYRYFP